MLDADTVAALRVFQKVCSDTSASKGFHDEGDRIRARASLAEFDSDLQALRNYYANKLMLIVSEATEAHEEIRAGHEVPETYYPTAPLPGQIVPAVFTRHKPEGVPSEIADIVIRCFDFAGEGGIDLAGMIQEKLLYNASRAHMHGGKKF